MNATHELLLTPRGVKQLQRERTDLRDWLGRLKSRASKQIADHCRDKEIDLILFEERVLENRLKRVDTVLDHVLTLPPVWDQKSEVRTGNIVYLRHKQTIRAFTLVATCDADPAEGKVSVLSPIGQALIGRHLGDTVRLDTLDGKLKYEIIKLV